MNNQTVHSQSIAANGNIYASGIIRLQYRNGQYLPAERLKPVTKGAHPFVAPDENYVIFDKRQPKGYAKDLYIIFRKPDNTWTAPLAFGSKINTPKKETNASVSPDGKYLFFGRNSDIYWVKATEINTLKTR